MARIRTIKPELPQSESLGRVSRDARYCFVLLFTIADDAGRVRAHSRLLASLLYPYDDDAAGLIDGWLDELQQENCIRRYIVDDAHYIDIPKWLEHQKIDRPSPSKLPAFDEASSVPREHSRADDEGSSTDLDLGPGPRKGPETRARPRASLPEGFEDWWEAYPNKVGKDAAIPAYRKALTKVEANVLKAGLLAYVRSKPPDRPWCNPATWLNQGRWADEPAEVGNVNGNGSHDPDNEAKARARSIAKGMHISSISDHEVRRMVAAGYITPEQAVAAGYEP